MIPASEQSDRIEIRRAAALQPRRNLVVVRAGDASTHLGWMRPGVERTWDLLINYYGRTDFVDAAAEYTVTGGISKYPALWRLHEMRADIFSPYKFFFFIDDDIELEY